MKQATHKWIVIGDVMVAMSTAGVIPDSVWELFVKDMRSKHYSKFLGVSVGSPEANSVQRKQVNEILKSRDIPVTLVTDEKLVRGMATAASWFGVNIKAFTWADLPAAIQHLNTAGISEERLLDELTKFRAAHSSG